MSIKLIDIIKPAGNFPAFEDTDGKGGFRVVADIAERNAILSSNRKTGMLVYVVYDNTFYKLEANLTTWTSSALNSSGKYIISPTITSNHTIQSTDDYTFYPINTTSSALVITLPSPSVVGPGARYLFKDISGTFNINNFSIYRGIGNTINNSNDLYYTTGINYNTIELISDGATNWYAINYSPSTSVYNISSSSKSILTASNTSPITITTSSPHNLRTGQIVSINGVTGNAGANNTFFNPNWIITVTSDTTFILASSIGTGSGTGGTAYSRFVIPTNQYNSIIINCDTILGYIDIELPFLDAATNKNKINIIIKDILGNAEANNINIFSISPNKIENIVSNVLPKKIQTDYGSIELINDYYNNTGNWSII